MLAPTVWLWLFFIAYAVASTTDPNGELPRGAGLVAQALLSMMMAWWVTADAHKRRHPLCHDFDAFVFFAWPVVMPVYLFRTRGWRALLTVLCFAAVWLLTSIAVAFLIFP